MPNLETREVAKANGRYKDQDRQNTHKLYLTVLTQIRHYIESRNLIPGDQLPTESEFCNLYNVSRSTVRHALRQIEIDGLVYRSRGKGTFLRDPEQPPANHANGPATISRLPRARKRTTIGVVLSYASEVDVMQTAILRGIEHAVNAHGYNVVANRTDDQDEAAELRAITDISNIGVSGLIVLPISNRRSTAGIRMLVEQKAAVVLVDRYLSDLETSYVVSDNRAGMYSATEHLILLGYTSFDFVVGLAAGPVNEQMATSSVRDRYEGYCQALRDYDLAELVCDPVAVDLTNRESVQHLLTHRADATQPPAIVAVHDYVAIEFMNTAVKIGLKPPDDYAIIGFDDLPIVSHLSVPLTTVVQPRYDIGFRAGHLLIDKLTGNPVRNDKMSLLVSLVVRQSCGAHRIAQLRRLTPAGLPYR